MNWNQLEKLETLKNIIEESENQSVLIFKHSTRCSISDMVLGRLERNWDKNNAIIKPYYLDLIAHRDISQEIAKLFDVIHESPQVLIIKRGKCTYSQSHSMISYSDIIQNA